MTKHVQVCGCITDGVSNIEPFQSDIDADFYGVYVGEPGDFKWQADFLYKSDAFDFARLLAGRHNYLIDDRTFPGVRIEDTEESE